MYRVKTTFLLFPSLLLFLLSACSERETIVAPADEGVEVVFSAKQSTVTRTGKENNLPSILIFRKLKDNCFSRDKNNEGQANWQKNSEEEGVYLNSILLPTGNYRFLLAGGFTEKETDGQVFFSSIDKSPTSDTTYDKDYFFSYSSSGNTEKGLPKLKTCRTDLFADANEKGFEANDREYSLAIGNQFRAYRKVTRLQARLDLLVRRGVKEITGVEPVPEGKDDVDAMDNALKKIKSIQIQVDGVSSRCHVDGLKFSTPGSYSFTLIEGTEYKFEKFKFELFKSDFNELNKEDYAKFENSAYCKGPLLFSAPDKEEKSDKEKVGVTVEINYKGILPKNTIHEDLLLERNKVTFLVIWLVNEEVKVTIEVDKENLEYSDKTKGDDGFWN